MRIERRFIRRATVVVGTLGVAGLAAVAGQLLASDHQDTPEVELNQQFDVNDVYAFPAATPGRVVLVLGTSSPVTPARTPGFSFGTVDQVLYQLKVDNTGDAVEDLVFQVTFTGTGPAQRVAVRGPVAPAATGTANTIVAGAPALEGRVDEVLGSATGVQLFAGRRDDPFFLDLEQFFRIIPDRKPETGELSEIPETPTASSFREKGAARDYLAGFNDMAIVIELPAAMLTANGARPKFGVWGTTSRPRGVNRGG